MSVNQAVFTNLESINPSAIIELFTIQLDSTLHGDSTIYRFHSGTSLNANGQIKWQDNLYLRFPIQASGFAFQRGQLPRPKLIISNAGLSNISSAIDNFSVSAILLEVNQTTPGNDLTGATVTRLRTLAKFLDKENFIDGVNPTEDKTAEFPKEVYKIDRKSTENREVVEFELAAPTDLAGIRVPNRRATRNDFPSIGTFIQ
tara:strand:- start:144 stop:749 length:606 start_codon:yes stop_codon:yes gene_type:complete